MNIKEAVRAAVDSFHITAQNGIVFWAPYLRNDDYTQNQNVPRGLGKSSAEDIKQAADYITGLYPQADADVIRRMLTDGSLPDDRFNYKGVDCSGFIFYVMDHLYQNELHKSLVDDLSVPKDHVLNGARNLEEWKAAYSLSEQEANSLPEDVPMRWVLDRFKRKPQNLCRVLGLVSDYSSLPVEPADLKTSDILHCQAPDSAIPHACIIYDLSADSARLAHSSGEAGVSVETVPLTNGYPDTLALKTARKFIAARRLKSLAG